MTVRDTVTDQHIQHWHTDGAVVIEDFFSAQQIAPIHADYQALYGEQGAGDGKVVDVKPPGSVGATHRKQFLNVDILPYQASVAMNLISLDPQLIALAKRLLGVDQALWDIKGKYHNTPVHQLLGGQVRDRIKVYAWVGGDRPADIVQSAQKAIGDGFSATKMNLTEELQVVDHLSKVDAAVERIASLREAVGNKLDIAVDFHGRVHAPMAKVLIKAIEPYAPLFIEEPVLSEQLETMAQLRRNTHIPIATGERLYSRFDFKNLFTLGAADIIQPDLSHAGGITECKKIAAMAESWDLALAPHCPLGPIALAACLQVDAVSQNAFIQEQSQGIHYNQSNDLTNYLSNPEVLHFTDGYVDIPQGPGLGVEINEDYVIERSKEGHRWHNPLWQHPDGSIAEW